jgi:hypothetical protein
MLPSSLQLTYQPRLSAATLPVIFLRKNMELDGIKSGASFYFYCQLGYLFFRNGLISSLRTVSTVSIVARMMVGRSEQGLS